MNYLQPSQKLQSMILTKMKDWNPTQLGSFTDSLIQQLPIPVLAIVAYGSYLSETTRKPTSLPDFFVIIDSYKTFYRKKTDRLINYLLPPNIYHFKIDSDYAKYNVISLSDLYKTTGPTATDCYLLGRFSKRLAIIEHQSVHIAQQLAYIQARSMHTICQYALGLMDPTFQLSTLITACLRISYLADIRVEASDKVNAILEADKSFYFSCYTDITKQLLSNGYLTVVGDMFELSNQNRKLWRKKVQRFITRSRLQTLLRWPKGMITARHWLDYVLAKIQRTKGITITLTPTQKKYWYIFGWKHLFFVLRNKWLG